MSPVLASAARAVAVSVVVAGLRDEDVVSGSGCQQAVKQNRPWAPLELWTSTSTARLSRLLRLSTEYNKADCL